MSLILSTVVATDIGLNRVNNEDSAFAGKHLVVLADGMGGMPAGELASDIVVKALANLEDNPDGGDPVARLREVVSLANQEIREKTEADADNDGMGTTVTALLLAPDSTGEDRLGLLNVGDSRCYLLRAGVLTQITKDDTFVQTLVDEGVLDPRDARHHPRRSLVTQALQGLDYQATCDLRTPLVGDRYLLCSDGLSDVVFDEEIDAALRTYPDRTECAKRLIDLALNAGGPDNITVVIADVIAG